MLIGLSGPRCSGKGEVADFLVQELGFTCLSSAAHIYAGKPTADNSCETLSTAQKLLSQCWRPDVNVVMENIAPHDPVLPKLLKRPFFLLVYVDAPVMRRYNRLVKREPRSNSPDRFQQFIEQDDFLKYGGNRSTANNSHSEINEVLDLLHKTFSAPSRTSDRDVELTLSRIERLSRVHILNDFDTLEQLRANLRMTNLTDPHLLRPNWDTYFMSLAKLASQRTNCMKRRVGCVIARDKRLVSSGYNGTPSGLTNCSEGGCTRCNGQQSMQGVGLDLCVCLHAEENAIIEAGRERCQGATLYASLFPCILCSKKIVQAGVSRVVYDKSYAMDEASENLLRAGGVVVSRFTREDLSDMLMGVATGP